MNAFPYRPTGLPGALHANWQSIDARPWSLMKLNRHINPLFPVGTIVGLSNELSADSRTPTKYPNQGPPDLNKSTRLIVYRWHPNIKTEQYASCDGGKPFSIQHKDLVHPVTGARKARGGWKLGEMVKVDIASTDRPYVTEKYPDAHGRPLVIPPGTVARVVKCMTGTNRARTKDQEETSTRVDWWYVLEVDVNQTKWEWIRCQEYINVDWLESTSAEEVQQTEDLIRRTAGSDAKPQVVSTPI